MIKILVLSDIHFPDRLAELPNLTEIAAGSDAVFCLGDFTTVEVVSYLKSLTKNFVGVRGNMDEHQVRQSLPEKMILTYGGVKIGITHGKGPPFGIQERVKKIIGKDVDAYLFGHSHEAFNSYIDEKLFFNPGAISSRERTYGYIYIEQGSIWGEIRKII